MPGFAYRRLGISAALGLVLLLSLGVYRYLTADVAAPAVGGDVCALVRPELLERALPAASQLAGQLGDAGERHNVCERYANGDVLQVSIVHFGRIEGYDPDYRARQYVRRGNYFYTSQPMPVQLGDESYQRSDPGAADVRIRLGTTVIAVTIERAGADPLEDARLIAQEVAARCGATC